MFDSSQLVNLKTKFDFFISQAAANCQSLSRLREGKIETGNDSIEISEEDYMKCLSLLADITLSYPRFFVERGIVFTKFFKQPFGSSPLNFNESTLSNDEIIFHQKCRDDYEKWEHKCIAKLSIFLSSLQKRRIIVSKIFG